MKRIVLFNKEIECPLTWYIHAVRDDVTHFLYTSPSTDPLYRWNFRIEEVDEVIDQLKAYNIQAVRHLCDRFFYTIQCSFDNDADEAEFIMKAAAGDITLDDGGDEEKYS